MENQKAKICVPVCVRRADEFAYNVKRAQEVADVIELRIDCVEPSEMVAALKEFEALHHSASVPFILTFRPAEQGGRRQIATADRADFWLHKSQSGTANSFPDFADVELELLERDDIRQQLRSERLICSHHDFVGVPDDLESIYGPMAATEASVLKIAVQAQDAVDCISVFKLLDRAQRESRELIAIAMGQAGAMTRILGPSRGSFLTYGSLDDDSATAPGQVTARELRQVYRIDSIDADTEILGVLGRPVGHSISPHIHNAAFARANRNAVFMPFEVHDLEAFIRRMVRPDSREIDWNLRGFSVTAPHKMAVLKHLDRIAPAAKGIGAVNTIVVQDNELHGYNTDVSGFIDTLKRRVASLSGFQCAVIGAGGAARAVIWALRNEGAAVTLFARNCDRAKETAEGFSVDFRSLVDAAFEKFDLVVNATPLGTRGETELETPATREQLRGVRVAYDLVYNPIETRFIREARAAGCETLGGLEMLIGQAVEQFKLWTGTAPVPETMFHAAKRALKESTNDG